VCERERARARASWASRLPLGISHLPAFRFLETFGQYTLQPALTLSTLQPTPSTLHSTPDTGHPNLSAIYNLRPISYTNSYKFITYTNSNKPCVYNLYSMYCPITYTPLACIALYITYTRLFVSSRERPAPGGTHRDDLGLLPRHHSGGCCQGVARAGMSCVRTWAHAPCGIYLMGVARVLLG